MNNAEKFIDLVGKLYNLPEKQIYQMQNNIPEIDAELGQYYWEDVRNKTQLFYARKNDKSRPRVCQILALLETDPNVTKKEPDPEPVKTQGYTLPTTKLWSITDTFNKLVKILVDAGAIPNQDGKFTNTRSLVNPNTNTVILDPVRWLKWELATAKNERPDIFASIPTKTVLEEIALAIQNNLITFRLRDWSKTVGGTK